MLSCEEMAKINLAAAFWRCLDDQYFLCVFQERAYNSNQGMKRLEPALKIYIV